MGRRVESAQMRTRLLRAVVVGTGAFLLAHSVNGVVADSLIGPVHQGAIVESPGPQSDAQPSSPGAQALAQDILASRLFPMGSSAGRGAVGRIASGAADHATPLNLAAKISLIGIVRGVKERAVIEQVPNKEQGLYAVSQPIPDVGELVAIEKERVLIRRGGQEEWLELAILKPPDATALPENPNQSPSRTVVDRRRLAQLMETPQAYLSEARVQPHFTKDGQLDGVRVSRVRQAGVLESVGLQSGDVVTGINGVEVREPGKLWDILKRLPQERTAHIDVIREKQPARVAFEIRG